MPFSQIEAVRHRTVRRRSGRNSSYTEYCTSLLVADENLPITESRNPLTGRRSAEQLANQLRLPLRDETSGAVVIREAGSLDEPFVSRLYRELSGPPESNRPEGTPISCQRVGGKLQIQFAPVDKSRMIALPVAPGLFLGLLSLMIAKSISITIIAALVGAAIGLGGLLSLYIETRMEADAQRLKIYFWGLLGEREFSFTWAELEEFGAGGRALFATSDSQRVLFGERLTDEERQWVIDSLIRYIFQPDEERPTERLVVPAGRTPVESAPQAEPEAPTPPSCSVWQIQKHARERLTRLGRFAFPVGLVSLPLFFIQHLDINRVIAVNVSRGYRLLWMSDYAPWQSLALFLGAAMLSSYLIRGREEELPPLGQVVCMVPFVLMGLYSIAVWLGGAKYSGIFSALSFFVVVTVLVFCAEGIGIVRARSSETRLRILAFGAGWKRPGPGLGTNLGSNHLDYVRLYTALGASTLPLHLMALREHFVFSHLPREVRKGGI